MSTPTQTAGANPKRDLLRHTLATLAYRGGKALRGAPSGFADFRVSDGTRTPGQILAHIGDLLDWALLLAQGMAVASAAGLLPVAVADANTALEGGVAVVGNVMANDTLGDPPTTVTAATQGVVNITIDRANAVQSGERTHPRGSRNASEAR